MNFIFIFIFNYFCFSFFFFLIYFFYLFFFFFFHFLIFIPSPSQLNLPPTTFPTLSTYHLPHITHHSLAHSLTTHLFATFYHQYLPAKRSAYSCSPRYCLLVKTSPLIFLHLLSVCLLNKLNSKTRKLFSTNKKINHQLTLVSLLYHHGYYH